MRALSPIELAVLRDAGDWVRNDSERRASYERLHARGCVRLIALVTPDWCWYVVTDLGRLALRVAVMIPAVEL